ncbi:hypothetical protein GQ44DRAFT_718724 [Phaeosphaeriaceae sp. PMI808]|nr:hypothetical protein GQ44DRAFT_718724 [Phaeosphaeriaceae sp. PMI808]
MPRHAVLAHGNALVLKAELGDLTRVLSALLETISNNQILNFQSLKHPLQRCGNACEEYSKIIANNISRLSMRD